MAATKACPKCAEKIKAAASRCRHCGYEFSADEMRKQADLEAANMRRGKIGCGAIVAVAVVVLAISHFSPSSPPTSVGITDSENWPASAKLLARATAGAAVKEQMANPGSFDLVDVTANPGKTDDGQPCWIVAVTYRGTNAFGGIVTNHAMVWVNHAGEVPLKVINLK